MEDEIFDGKKADKLIMDEIGQMPLRFVKSGCEFRWQCLKMIFELNNLKLRTVKDATDAAEEIIKWVNRE